MRIFVTFEPKIKERNLWKKLLGLLGLEEEIKIIKLSKENLREYIPIKHVVVVLLDDIAIEKAVKESSDTDYFVFDNQEKVDIFVTNIIKWTIVRELSFIPPEDPFNPNPEGRELLFESSLKEGFDELSSKISDICNRVYMKGNDNGVEIEIEKIEDLIRNSSPYFEETLSKLLWKIYNENFRKYVF